MGARGRRLDRRHDGPAAGPAASVCGAGAASHAAPVPDRDPGGAAMTAACPIAAAQDALMLLRTGRAAMAHRILEGLPALIDAALVRGEGIAYLRGQADAHRIVAAAQERQRIQPQPV